ncbi:MAG: hypothetical protein ACE37F_21315 [Nannocystaceae bacterium]
MILAAAAFPVGDPGLRDSSMVVHGTSGSDFIAGRHSVLAGRGGHDVLRADGPHAQLAGGAGFDVLLLPHGADRAATGRNGGLVWARGQTTVQLGHGVSIVIGSDADDEVHVWGGTNLLLLGGGDDTVVVHRRSTVIAVGGSGHDVVCLNPGPGRDRLLVGFEERCTADEVVSDRKADVVGVLHPAGVVWARGEAIIEDPTPTSLGGPCTRYALEVWAVLEGADPGEAAFVVRPGGNYVWPDGTGLDSPSQASPVPVQAPTELALFANEPGGFLRFDARSTADGPVVDFSAAGSAPNTSSNP